MFMLLEGRMTATSARGLRGLGDLDLDHDEPTRTDDDITHPLTLHHITLANRFYLLSNTSLLKNTPNTNSSSMCKKATCTDCGMSTSHPLCLSRDLTHSASQARNPGGDAEM